MRLFIIALAVVYVTMVGLAQTFSFDVFSAPLQSTISAHGIASTPPLDSGVFTQVEGSQACGIVQGSGKLENTQCIEE